MAVSPHPAFMWFKTTMNESLFSSRYLQRQNIFYNWHLGRRYSPQGINTLEWRTESITLHVYCFGTNSPGWYDKRASELGKNCESDPG